MAAVQRKLVHKQFNSPMGLYSQQNVKETLDRELKAFGSDGIEVDEQIAKPLNLANSAVLRAVEEEEQMKCAIVRGRICERQSRPRHRCAVEEHPAPLHGLLQRPCTPLHQQQLDQIKTEYYHSHGPSHAHDVTIDRDTVLKINRLATRRHLQRRDHSWPPPAMGHALTARTNDGVGGGNGGGGIASGGRTHSIDAIREKFKSPSRIIEPTAAEVRQRRKAQQQQRPEQQLTKQLQRDQRDQQERRGQQGLPQEGQVQNVDLLRYAANKSQAPGAATCDVRQRRIALTNAPHYNNTHRPDTSSLPTIAAETAATPLQPSSVAPLKIDADDGARRSEEGLVELVEPRRRYFEQLADATPGGGGGHRAQAHSLDRSGARSTQQERRYIADLPPLKPRASSGGGIGGGVDSASQSPKLQRRPAKLATDLKTACSADAEDGATTADERLPTDSSTATTTTTTAAATLSGGQRRRELMPPVAGNDLEHLPLPEPPPRVHHMQRSPAQARLTPVMCEPPSDTDAIGDDDHAERNDEMPQEPQDFSQPCRGGRLHGAVPSAQQLYDDACIYLRSIDGADRTLAYVPAAITIVPSPTKDMLQRWTAAKPLAACICSAGGVGPVRVEPPTYVAHHGGVQLRRRGDVVNNGAVEAPKDVVGGGARQARRQGVYYTDGEYVYGPFEGSHGAASVATTPATTTKSTAKTEAEMENANATPQQQHQQQPEPPTAVAEDQNGANNKFGNIENRSNRHNHNSRNANEVEIAALAAKYGHIQQSIAQHLRQIDACMATAKLALSRSLEPDAWTQSSAKLNDNATGVAAVTAAALAAEAEADVLWQQLLAARQSPVLIVETPLQALLRQLQLQLALPPARPLATAGSALAAGLLVEPLENMPVVEWALDELAGMRWCLERLPPQPQPQPPAIGQVLTLHHTTMARAARPTLVHIADEECHDAATTAEAAVSDAPVEEQEMKELHSAQQHDVVARIADAAVASFEHSTLARRAGSAAGAPRKTTTLRHQVQPHAPPIGGDVGSASGAGVVAEAGAADGANQTPASQAAAEANLNQLPRDAPCQQQSGTVVAATAAEPATCQPQRHIISAPTSPSPSPAAGHEAASKAAAARNQHTPPCPVDDGQDNDVTDVDVDADADDSDDTATAADAGHVADGTAASAAAPRGKLTHDDAAHAHAAANGGADTFRATYAMPCRRIAAHESQPPTAEAARPFGRQRSEVHIAHDPAASPHNATPCHSESTSNSVAAKSTTAGGAGSSGACRKYPPPAYEPRAASPRAASPFGLNAVRATPTPSPPPPPPPPVAEPAEEIRASYVFVPQVEGHNVGLVVRSAMAPPAPVQTPPLPPPPTPPTTPCHSTHAPAAAAANDNDYVHDDGDSSESADSVDGETNYAAPGIGGSSSAVRDRHRQAATTTTTTTTGGQRDLCEHSIAAPATGQRQRDPKATAPSSAAINRSFDNVSPRPYNTIEGYKRVAWPPVSEERIIREFTPQPQTQPLPPQPHYNQAPPQQHQQQHHQQHQHQNQQPPSAVAPPQGPIYNNVHGGARQNSPYPNQYQQTQPQPHPESQPQRNYQAPPQQQQPPMQYTQAQYGRQPSYEASPAPAPAPAANQSHPTHHQYQQQQPQYNQQPQYHQQHQPEHLPGDYNAYQEAPTSPIQGWKPIRPPQAKQLNQYHGHTQQHQQSQAQYRASSYDNYQQQQQAPPYTQAPAQNSYPYQPQQQQQQQQQPPQWAHQQQTPQYQPQYQPQPLQQQQQQLYQAPPPSSNYQFQAPQPQQPQHYQSEPVANHYNSYSQPPISQDQPDYQQQALPQDYRGGSPGIITLRKEAPVSQKPAPVITSQPAAVSFQGGSNMRGDLKWPPPEYKEAAARENEERRKLALGPVCRPRKVNRDYKPFFEKNALICYYPSYKIPPGTQHMFA